MGSYIWWVPFTVAVAISCAYATVQVNKNPSSLWFWYMFIPLTVWPFISRSSTNIAFDGLLYDIIVAVSWLLGFIIFGVCKDFSWINYLGLLIAAIGLILLKV